MFMLLMMMMMTTMLMKITTINCEDFVDRDEFEERIKRGGFEDFERDID